MKMIRKTLYTASALGALMLHSCSKKIDEAYANPNANVRQPVELLLPNVIQNMAISNTANGTLYGPQNDGQYVGRYIQFWATNTSNNQYDQMGGATGASDILGSVWAMHYYGMGQNISRIIEWGTEEKKWDYVGVAHALRAWSWLTLTDMYGDVILKDAFNTSKLVFTYDKQEEVYEEVKRQCRLALENLNKTGDNVSQANLALGDKYFYNGDVEKWKKFTNSVMAKVFHRITNKTSYQPDSVIYYANRGIITNNDNAYVKFEGTATVKMSFYGPTRGNIGTLRQTRFAADLFTGTNQTFSGVSDPRVWYKLRENSTGNFRGIRPVRGIGDVTPATEQPPNFWGTTTTTGSNATTRYIWRDAMDWPVMTASEILFTKAEAQYLKGEKANALASYTEAISLDFDLLTTKYNDNVPTARQITPAMKAAYMANPRVIPAVSDFTLSHIMLQKFIALYGWGIIETWVDMRRYHYTDLEMGTTRQVYTNFEPPAPGDLFRDNMLKFVYRARPRYNSEYLYNVDALNQVGAMSGNSQVLDYHTREMWFSQP